MSAQCTGGNRAAFETGRLSPEDMRVFRPGGLDLTAHALALAELSSGARVLDLGCGTGATLDYLESIGVRGVGVDCSPEALACRSEAMPQRIVASAEQLPFPNKSFDGVLLECTLSLVNDQARALAECSRVLEDHGRLVISDLYARRPEAMAVVRTLSGCCAAGMLLREELVAVLGQTGFHVEVWEDHSRALRECAAQYIFEHGSTDGLWNCGPQTSDVMDSVMRSARAGYFLLVARRRPRLKQVGEFYER